MTTRRAQLHKLIRDEYVKLRQEGKSPGAALREIEKVEVKVGDIYGFTTLRNILSGEKNARKYH